MPTLPSIDIVIIGLNSAKTLPACLESVAACQNHRGSISLFYADGGSIDDSVKIAESFGCRCVALEGCIPTPGRQRNLGWRLGSSEYVQFLDSDTILDPDWLHTAISAFSTKAVGAVCGDRRELRPEATVFNWIGDLEWNGEPGETDFFGGDVLVSRAALESTGGYDPDLIAGEDPELSYRIRQAGWKLVRLAEPMTRHDLAMRSLGQYWKRAFRSGHAYAEIHAKHADVWGEEVRRITIRTLPFLIGVLAAPFALLAPWLLLAPLAGGMLMIRPRMLLVEKFRKALSLTRREARIYAWHASLVVLPQFFGILRYHLGRLLARPLTNRRILPRGGSKAAGG